MNCIKNNIPNSITCLNLLAGCISIIAASKPLEITCSLPGYQWAFIFIGIGAIADFFDGFAARALHAYSNLGKELDSLCDLVTFGVAPAMIIFNLLQAFWPGTPLAWGALLIPVSGAIRLARFNIDTRQTTTFIGLPIPANAIFWIGYASALATDHILNLGLWFIFLPVLVLECLLMNMSMKMFSLKIKNFSFKNNIPQILLVISAVVFCIIWGTSGLLALILFYIFLSVIFQK